MLAPPSDFGYSPNHAAYHQHHPAQPMHQHSEERPKIFGMDPGHNGGPSIQMMAGHDYHHQMVHHGTPHHHHHAMTPHAGMTPQHAAAMTPQHHQEYEHEPLVMNVPPATHYYAPMGAHMLLVSSDYDYNSAQSSDGATPKNKPGTKRSREDLNMKEKKRMFKLNDRINQLKQMLEDSGVQTKKNKQSILDNAAYFIEQLRSDLMIAKQKAERAEKEAEQLKMQAQKSTKGDSNNLYQDNFLKSTTPRVLVDLNLRPVSINQAFVKFSGHNEAALQKKETLVACLCADAAKLESIVSKVRDENKPTSAMVEVSVGGRSTKVVLMASAVAGDDGKPASIEFSVAECEPAAEQKEAEPVAEEQTSAEPVKAEPEPETESPTAKADDTATDSDASVDSTVV
ncbi:hypothetical protein Poli38472_012399 [Pythium oligandrum]|uniref:BHLH domain-containing protein n=1 Tax=Pythium oligandrum TaxID=41045 RepID=A0A8K1CS25_PYTOL|nr:hypothetical protein Poli38472_012399 [Pythium oligandrum]|eukprot:TMW67283.1 hypothetical protein Poli38472_012399 [Pythium oligandrum]